MLPVSDTLFDHQPCSVKIHIPSDLVVDQWDSSVEVSQVLDSRFAHF
jgi:hypothetical protein